PDNIAMEVLNTLLPVFFMIALGAFLHRIKFLSDEVVTGLNGLVFWVGLPSLLFYEIIIAEYNYSLAGKTFLVILAATILCVVAGYIVAFLLKMPGPSVGAFVQGAFRGNLYYIGLAVLLYSIADYNPVDAERIKNIAILVLAFIIPIYNFLAVIILLAGRQRLGRRVILTLSRQIVTNPLIIACVAGLIYQFIFPPLPLAISRTLSEVGQISLPLALIAVGAALVQSNLGSSVLWSVIATVIKIAFAPVVGLLFAMLLNLGPGETKVALIMLACPTAAVSYVMAEQLGADEKLSAAIVTVSTVLSIISLGIVLAVY
ncbi:MAG: AEC family transporter, partial [Phycisphaerae bacterium]